MVKRFLIGLVILLVAGLCSTGVYFWSKPVVVWGNWPWRRVQFESIGNLQEMMKLAKTGSEIKSTKLFVDLVETKKMPDMDKFQIFLGDGGSPNMPMYGCSFYENKPFMGWQSVIFYVDRQRILDKLGVEEGLKSMTNGFSVCLEAMYFKEKYESIQFRLASEAVTNWLVSHQVFKFK